jgi:hypothetical protein
MSLEFALPQTQYNINCFGEIDVAHELDKALAAHECGHAVCALANGVQVHKIQNGVRRRFTIYDMRTFPDTQVRKLVSIAGPVAESDYWRQMGWKREVCSTGDAAHILGHEESGADILQKLRAAASYKNLTRVADLETSLNGYLMDGKALPFEFRHLLGSIKEARNTLMAHRNAHTSLVAALFDKGGVLRRCDIQRVWEANKLCQEGGELNPARL